MMKNTADNFRRALIEEGVPEAVLAKATAEGERVWDTAALKAEFKVTGFLAPFVFAIRIADGKECCLMFTHSPRFYFDLTEED